MQSIRQVLFNAQAVKDAASSIPPAAVVGDGGRRFHLWACAVVLRQQELHGDLDRDWLHLS